MHAVPQQEHKLERLYTVYHTARSTLQWSTLLTQVTTTASVQAQI